MQHGQVVTDQEITLLPRMPICHAAIVQQRVQCRANRSALLLVDALTLNRHECCFKLGLALRPGLMVVQHRPPRCGVVQDQGQLAQLGRTEACRRNAPGQRAEVLKREPLGQVAEQPRAGSEKREARVLGARRRGGEHLEAGRVGLDLVVRLARAVLQLEDAARLDRLEHAVKVERHPLGAEHVVQPPRVCPGVLDFQHEPEEPRRGRAELVRLGLVPRAVGCLLEAADNDRGVVLGEGSHLGGIDVFNEKLVAGAAGGRGVGCQDHAAGVDGGGNNGSILPGHQGTEVLVAVVTRATILVDEIVRLVGVKVGAVAGTHGTVEIERHGAVPGGREGRRGGGQRADGELVLARGGVDGQPHMIGEVLADSVRKGLAALEHLLGDVLDAHLEALVALALARRVDVLQVGLEELDITPIGETSVLALGDFLAGVPVLSAVCVDECGSVFGGVSHICDFCELQVGVDVGQLVQAGKADLFEAFFHTHGSKSLAICPHILVRNTEKV